MILDKVTSRYALRSPGARAVKTDIAFRNAWRLLEAVASVVAVLLITGILALLFVVVLRSRLNRFVMSFEAWKIKFSVEVDSEARPEEVQDNRHRALPDGKARTP